MNRLIIKAQKRLQDAADRLQEDPESGAIDDVPWKAILTIGGGILAVTILGLVTAWSTGYFERLNQF